MLNRFEGIGRLGKDPEVRVTTGEKQTSVCRFSIAVDKGYGQNKKTIWVNVVTFGKLAENCGKFLAKGRQTYVAGELDIQNYEKQDGSKGTFVEVVANTVEFLNSGENQGWGQPQQTPQPQWSNPQWSQPPAQPQEQQMTYQQYQEQKKYEESQMPQDVASGFQKIPSDQVPF